MSGHAEITEAARQASLAFGNVFANTFDEADKALPKVAKERYGVLVCMKCMPATRCMLPLPAVSKEHLRTHSTHSSKHL